MCILFLLKKSSKSFFASYTGIYKNKLLKVKIFLKVRDLLKPNIYQELCDLTWQRLVQES